MRFFGILIIILFAISSFSQKREKEKSVIPENQSDSLKLEAMLIEAEKQLILEDFEKALNGFTKALEMNSESAAINFKIAQVLAKSRKSQKAIPYGLKAIALDPENKYYRLSLARIYQSVGFYIESAKTYEHLLELYPSEENALYELVELYQMTGKTEEVLTVFDKIENELGIKEEIIREKQRIYIKEGKFDNVIQEYKKLINAYPNESAHRIELISFLIQNKRLEEASNEIADYQQSEPASSRVTLLKSKIEWMQGNYEDSMELLEEAFESPTLDFESKFQILSNYFLSSVAQPEKAKLAKLTLRLAKEYPEEYKAQVFVADMLYREGEKQQSLSYYLKAVHLKPASFSVWQNILNIEGELNQTDSMIVHSEKALEYFPNQALLYYFAGTGLLIKKEFKKAVRMLDMGKKYTVDPNLLTVFYGQLGDAYNGLKETKKSYEAYENALLNDYKNDHVLNNYSYFLSLEAKNLDKALKMSTQLISQHPDNPTYLDTHGWVLYRRGNFKESKKYLEKAVALDEDGTIIEHFGDVLFRLGKTEEALRQWERAKEVGGASEFINRKIADQKLYE
ncbi:MAG: tetratricopeptide repeat protein [Ekhidna sp.]|nr:tetratricopeptide repeat protein [Ekhidna sp.]